MTNVDVDIVGAEYTLDLLQNKGTGHFNAVRDQPGVNIIRVYVVQFNDGFSKGLREAPQTLEV